MAQKKLETLTEEVKAWMQSMQETLKQNGPDKWNLLVQRQPKAYIQVIEVTSYEAGRAEQERIIKRDNPVMTALVKDKKRR